MEKGEKKIKQEDCSEVNLGSGILTLTNKRLAFDKTRARMMDFSKHFGDTILDVSLDDVTKTWKEGLLIKKVCFTAKTSNEEQSYKFGVFNTKNWLKSKVPCLTWDSKSPVQQIWLPQSPAYRNGTMKNLHPCRLHTS